MKLVVLGLGYSAAAFVRDGAPRFTSVDATVRSPAKAAAMGAAVAGVSINAHVWAGGPAPPALAAALSAADALLVSVPAEDGGDPVLRDLGAVIADARPRWIGYLSTVGVYGDHQGAVVTETSALRATSARGINRIAAEQGWLQHGAHVFRLAGIYGPGRNQLVNLREGSARRIVKDGQVFSRIHRDDIAGTCLMSLTNPNAGTIYNVADDEPAPPQDVIAFAAGLLGVPPPEEEPFETAALSPMARSFYLDSRRVSNARLTGELGYRMRYPTYREGLRALFAAGEGR